MRIDIMNAMRMLRQMGVNMKELSAEEVIIKGEEKIIIKNPKVSIFEYGGKRFYMIEGEEEREEFSEEDINLLMEKTGKSREEVLEALKKSGGDLIKALEILGG